MTTPADRPWDAFRSTLERTHVDLGVLCRSIAHDIRATTTNVAIDVRISGELDGQWDADGLALVVSRVLRHAVEHAAEGSLVTLDAWEDIDDCVAFAVMDEGRSLPREEIASIFGAHDLRLACEIVHDHGGRIEARSFEGKTVVGITLPRARGQL